MDITEQNIKMCAKATKIQEQMPLPEKINEQWESYQYPPEHFISVQGSVYWLPFEREFVLFHWDNDEDTYIIGHYHSVLDGMVWLPRLDQLLAMLTDACFIIHYRMPGYRVTHPAYHVMFERDTAEQALLEAVMYFQYNMAWTGEDWKEMK